MPDARMPLYRTDSFDGTSARLPAPSDIYLFAELLIPNLFLDQAVRNRPLPNLLLRDAVRRILFRRNQYAVYR